MKFEPDDVEQLAAAIAPRIAALVIAELEKLDSTRSTVPPPESVVSVRRAAELAGVSIGTVRRAYRSGSLRATRPGGGNRIVICVEDLREWALGDEQLVDAKL